MDVLGFSIDKAETQQQQTSSCLSTLITTISTAIIMSINHPVDIATAHIASLTQLTCCCSATNGRQRDLNTEERSAARRLPQWLVKSGAAKERLKI